MEVLKELPIVPVVNLFLILFVLFMGRRWVVRDRAEETARQELQTSINASIDKKFLENNAKLMTALEKKFQPKESCEVLHAQLDRLGELPARVARIEGRLDLKDE